SRAGALGPHRGARARRGHACGSVEGVERRSRSAPEGLVALGETHSMPKVAVIGAGLIGRAWAIVFARAGWSVAVTDSSPAALAAAPALLSTALSDLAEHGLVDDATGAAARIAIAASTTEAVADADFVQECGPETLADKIALFRALDAAAPRNAILASSS